jgi:hypothetical protein
MNLREIKRGSMDWIPLAWDKDQWQALVNMVMNPPVTKSVVKFFK